MRPPSTRICALCGEPAEEGAGYCPRDGAPLDAPGPLRPTDAPDPRLGVVLPGEIRLERLAGVGASSRLYRGHQGGIDRAVAVKILRERGTLEARERFHKEARLASRIVHPHVVTVLLTGELPASAGAAAGEPYAVLEWLEGPTLGALLAAARPAGGGLDLVRALRIALRLADALAEAHQVGVLHRDVKPENVILVRRGEDPDFVKLLDFGLAALSAPAGREGAPREPGLVGTAAYLAPEAAKGRPVPASDVHAVAAILYEMLAGRPPFEATSAAAVLAARAGREPPDVRTHARASYVPAPIAAFLAAALARDPARRPRDGRALGEGLERAAVQAGHALEDLVGNAGRRPLRLAPQQRTRPHDPREGERRGAAGRARRT